MQSTAYLSGSVNTQIYTLDIFKLIFQAKKMEYLNFCEFIAASK